MDEGNLLALKVHPLEFPTQPMFISITHKGAQAKTLPTLLQLQQDRVHTMDFAFGKAHAFFATLEPELAEAVLMLEIAQASLLRPPGFEGYGQAIRQYVHAKAYATSAFMAVAIGKAFEKAIQQADKTALDLDILLVAVESGVDATELHKWLRPWGWQLSIETVQRDADHPEWGNARCINLRLRGRQPLALALSHLQILLTALDEDHLFWLGDLETEKMIALARPFLEKHPHSILGALASYPDRRQLQSMGQLLEEDESVELPPPPAGLLSPEQRTAWEAALLDWMRSTDAATVTYMQVTEASSVIAITDLPQVQQLILLHAELSPLQQIAQQVNRLPLPDAQKVKLGIYHASPLLQNPQFAGKDAVIVEGILQTMPAWQLSTITSMVFGFLKPKHVIWLEPALVQFENWASAICKDYPYELRILPMPIQNDAMQFAIFELKA